MKKRLIENSKKWNLCINNSSLTIIRYFQQQSHEARKEMRNLPHIDKKTSQNISDILKEIGELSTLFYLYCHFNFRGWSVYKNYNEKGYDILLFNDKKRQKRKIEVKTRQRIISSASNRNQRVTHFTLTEVERREADFLVCLWLEHNWFFIVPTSKLKLAKSNSKKLYKFIVTVKKNGELDYESEKYLDNWSSIIRKTLALFGNQ